MKKILTLIFLAFITTNIFGQDSPYRLIIHEKSGNIKAYSTDALDSISFKKLTSDVSVDITIHEVVNDGPDDQGIIASFIRSEACYSYRFAVVPKNTADLFGDNIPYMLSYFDGDPDLPWMQDDLDHAELFGFNFNFVPGVYYTVMVLAYDEFGIPCKAQKKDFQVPDIPLVGNPSVSINVDEATPTTLTVTMTPNDDCKGFYCCLFEPGLAESQYNEFAPEMGFACMGDMIKAFGHQLHEDVYTTTWDLLAAGVEYDVYVLPLDANGNYGDMVISKAKTLTLGGEGLAEMTISLGEFSGDAEYGYYQEIIFTPNDQTSAHRDIVAKKSAFDDGIWTEESLLDYMKHDKNPDYPDFLEDPDWDKFGVHKGNFPVTPGKTYYVYSIGKNIKGEYGPFVKLEFTAPQAATKTMINSSSKGVFVKEKNATNDYVLPGGNVIKKRMMIRQ